MKITLRDQYKSLHPFVSEELTDLVVITGKNGSGKTQLLDLIGKKASNENEVASIRLEIGPNVENIQAEGLIKKESAKIGIDQWKSILSKKYEQFQNLSESSIQLLEFIEENNIIPNNHANKLLSDDDKYKELISKVYSEIRNEPIISNEKINFTHQRKVIRIIHKIENINLIKLINEIISKTEKPLSEITDSDFYNTPIQEYLIDENDLFESKIEIIFFNYAKRRHKNHIDYFSKKEYKEDNNSVSDIEFVRKSPPPWEIINGILIDLNIDFYFKGIERKEFTEIASIDFKPFKKSTDESIEFSDLSSGEKVIIGLILKLFTSKYYDNNLTFPDLLILDEPDAHLHPEMSKLLLDVLEDTFVKKYNVKVIITTHSPSTIALAPENCIYQLKNVQNSSLNKINKDDALQLLTNFIPTLNIDYRNHRHVFVESPTDVFYYQTLYGKHQQQETLDYKLYFISNSNGKGNSAQVKDIVSKLRDSGNSTSFGIIDWDTENVPSDYIKVHGYNESWSLENYLLNPIYIYSLLMDMGNAHDVYNKLGIDQSFNHFLLGELHQEKLQNYIKLFFEDFESSFQAYKYETNKIEIKFYNGKELLVPKWFMQSKGHNILEKVKNVYSALQKYQYEGDLQRELSLIISKSYPFIPVSSIKTIKEISHQELNLS
ncbi:ATP-binding protein [Balneolales bacterium ANBcel1]|nr:ATP-binding protein [Balneolales bacterium ANBcel1]